MTNIKMMWKRMMVVKQGFDRILYPPTFIEDSDERLDTQAQRYCRQLVELKGFVYLAHLETTPYYKIGLSKHPEFRFSGTTTLPVRTVMIHTIPTNHMYWLEGSLHKQFADKRGHGEWFTLTDQDIEYIKSIPECYYMLGEF